jgi:hypothetical protein
MRQKRVNKEKVFMSFDFYLYRIPNIIDIKRGGLSLRKITVIF